MSDDISRKISQLLMEGQTKKQIYDQLRSNGDSARISFLLNNEAELVDKKKYQYLNLFMAIILLWLTFIKVSDAMALGRFDLYWLASLVVPMIHIFVLRKILRFHRTGSQFLFVLSCLALFRPENRQFPEFIIIILLLIVSSFLYFKLFPAHKMIKQKVSPKKG